MSWRGRCNVSVKRKRLSRQMWGSRLSLRWWRSSMTCRMASGVCARRKLAPRIFLSYRYLLVWINRSFFWYGRETLEAQTAIIEERYEDKIAILQKHLKNFYSQELKVRASCKLQLICNHYTLNKRDQRQKNIFISFRRGNRRLKLWLLPLRRGRKMNLYRHQLYTTMLKVLDALSGSWLKVNRADFTWSWSSVALSCWPERRVRVVFKTTTLLRGLCSRLPSDFRGDKIENAAGSPWFSWNLHQLRRPQAGGGTEGQLPLGF